MSFANLGLCEPLVRAVNECGYTEPTPIQLQAIPVVLQGRDLLAAAQTGTGKTAGFTLPILQHLETKPVGKLPNGRHPIRVLVLTPTRELAAQVHESVRDYGKHLSHNAACVFGGVNINPQIAQLRGKVDVLVATPGRLLDHVGQRTVDLSHVEILVLDEADRMADDGFTPQVEWIMRKVTAPHQTMLFSATLDGDVGHLVARYMNDPAEVAIDAATDTVGTMHHLFLAVHHMDKDKVVASIASGMAKTIVFCQTKRTCDRVERNLQELGVRAAAIHGDLAQAARERALKRFTDGDLAVLVATDVAARGIDVDDIGAVIHYEPAGDVKDYLHRSGRTARAGRDGWAVTMAEYNQHTQVRILQRAMRLDPSLPIEVFSNNPKLKHLPDFHV